MIFENEAKFQKACNEYLRDNNIKFFHMEKGRTHKSTTHRKGWFDLMIFTGHHNVFFIELKMPGKKLRPDQVDFMGWAQDKNYSAYVCFNWEEFLQIMDIENE